MNDIERAIEILRAAGYEVTKKSGATKSATKSGSFESNFRTFKESDWWGYAGAVKLPDGTGPFRATTDEGIDIILSGEEGSRPRYANFSMYYEEEMYGVDDMLPSKAKRLANGLFNDLQSGVSIEEVVKKYGMFEY